MTNITIDTNVIDRTNLVQNEIQENEIAARGALELKLDVLMEVESFAVTAKSEALAMCAVSKHYIQKRNQILKKNTLPLMCIPVENYDKNVNKSVNNIYAQTQAVSRSTDIANKKVMYHQIKIILET